MVRAQLWFLGPRPSGMPVAGGAARRGRLARTLSARAGTEKTSAGGPAGRRSSSARQVR